jgi:hypothetical protein
LGRQDLRPQASICIVSRRVKTVHAGLGANKIVAIVSFVITVSVILFTLFLKDTCT